VQVGPFDLRDASVRNVANENMVEREDVLARMH
jgi:hypothetical protein